MSFHQSNGPKICQLHPQLVTVSQGSLSMEAYFTKIKTLWQDLYDFRPIDECSCGAAKSLFSYLEPEYVMIFFMGFNETYASTHAQILLMDPLPSISNTPQPRKKFKKYCRSIFSCCYEIIEREIASDKTILKFVCHGLWYHNFFLLFFKFP